MALATEADVAKRLGRELDETEELRVEGLLEEASVLVEEYLGCTPDPVPDAVRVVTSRMVARALGRPTGTPGITPGQLSAQQTMGPFSRSATFEAGSTSGGPWVEAKDKAALRRHRCGAGMVSIGMASDHTGRFRMRA